MEITEIRRESLAAVQCGVGPVVVEVQGNTITIDAPITCAIEKRWGGGEVVKYEDPGRIENVGVENLRGMSEFDPTKRTKEYGNMDRPNYVAEEYYADEITTGTSSPSTTYATAGCGTSRHCTLPTAWWARSAVN